MKISPDNLFRITDSAILKLTPRDGGKIEITPITEVVAATPKERFNKLEFLAETALSRIYGLHFQPAFKRLFLTQRGAEIRELDREITVRVSVTFAGHSPGVANGWEESAEASLVGEGAGESLGIPLQQQQLREGMDEAAAEKILTEILEEFPCTQCGAVEILTDAKIPGATCDCGRKEGAQVRWETGDIWSQMSESQQQQAEAAEEVLNAS